MTDHNKSVILKIQDIFQILVTQVPITMFGMANSTDLNTMIMILKLVKVKDKKSFNNQSN
jgi:hypothetical protein